MTFLNTAAPLITVAGAYGIALWQQAVIIGRERRARRRELSAARATLPLTLSEVDRNITQALKLIRSLYSGEADIITSDWPAVDLASKRGVRAISECIRSSEDEEAKPLIYMLSKIQIFQSRLDKILKTETDFRLRGTREFDQMLFDLYMLRELINKFYKYGRFISEDVDVSITRQAMRDAFILADLNMGSLSRLSELIESRPYADVPPDNKLFFRSQRSP